MVTCVFHSPPRYVPSFLSRIGLSIPNFQLFVIVTFHRNFLSNSHSRAFRSSYLTREEVPTLCEYKYALGRVRTSIIDFLGVVETRFTYYSVGDTCKNRPLRLTNACLAIEKRVGEELRLSSVQPAYLTREKRHTTCSMYNTTSTSLRSHYYEPLDHLG